MLPLLSAAALLEIAQHCATIELPCNCSALPPGWAGWPVSLRENQLVQIGTLAQFEEEDATLDEFHPDGTYYWSPGAPIAPRFYPYNQCGLWQCNRCQRAFLRYNDDGAYHSEARIRRLSPELIVDAGHPFNGRYRPQP
ncbi:hypothetical protein [Pseudomonas sp. RIT-PI-S]|uniref:hypothetical protein n=1 Tax=Pseudomonas sp. RIT-PI-S TaxID=3035295 RepID=UPI0021DA76FF|nr:hypothetical protein [Pseudomonas sp. RIT-PI-S]